MANDQRGASSATFVQDLRSLVAPARSEKGLSEIPPKGALPAQRGRADYQAKATASGGGIAGPLQEVNVGLREYHEYRNVPTSDGLFVFLEQPIKKIVLRDANGDDVAFIYQQEPL